MKENELLISAGVYTQPLSAQFFDGLGEIEMIHIHVVKGDTFGDMLDNLQDYVQTHREDIDLVQVAIMRDQIEKMHTDAGVSYIDTDILDPAGADEEGYFHFFVADPDELNANKKEA